MLRIWNKVCGLPLSPLYTLLFFWHVYLNSRRCAIGQPSLQAKYPIIVFCQVAFQLAEVLQPCSITSSLVGVSGKRHRKCGGTPQQHHHDAQHHPFPKAQAMPALSVL